MTPMMHERVRNMFGDAGLTAGFTVQQLMYDDPGDLSKAIMVFRPNGGSNNQLRKLNTNVSGIARAMEEARSGTGGANSEFNRAESIIEALGNQLAVLDEAQENGARSAAVLAAQLRAGSKATDEEKQKIRALTPRLALLLPFQTLT